MTEKDELVLLAYWNIYVKNKKKKKNKKGDIIMFDYSKDSKNAADILDKYDFTQLLEKTKKNPAENRKSRTASPCSYVCIYSVYDEIRKTFVDKTEVLEAIKALTKDELGTYLFNKYNVRATENNI